MITGIYTGSFDPITNGHLDIIKRSMQFCDYLTVAVGVNPGKKSMFSDEEKLTLIFSSLHNLDLRSPLIARIDARVFQGLAVNFANKMGATVMIRGIRSVSDFEYEINLANINKTLAPNVETVFLPTSPEMAVVSSSAAKEIAKYNGDISKFVPKCVEKALFEKLGGRSE